jgi:glycosyltransferase involved in cell wall biosynthesis
MEAAAATGEGVIQVCISPSWGGLEMHVHILSRSLIRRGVAATVVCRAGSPLDRQLARDGIPRLPVGGGDYLAPGAMRSIRNCLRESGYRLIHSHFSRDIWKVVPVIRWSPTVALVHTRHINSGVVKRDPLHRWLYRRVDGWIATSEDGRANLLKTHPVDPERVHIVHLGVTLTENDPASSNRTRTRIREDLGIDEETIVVGMLGRLTPNKGHLTLFQAAPRVREEAGSRVSFLIVGGPSSGEEAYEDSLRGAVSEMELGEFFRFTGHREDVHELLSAMDIYALPSYKESFGVSLLEAMSHALPVIATAIGGPLEVVEDGNSGLLVPPRDADRLAEAIIRLVRNTELREQLGKGALERVRRHFSEDSMVDGIQDVYRLIRR